MKTLILSLALAVSLHAESPFKKAPHALFRWSVAALAAGNGLDAASSYGMREQNPLLARGGMFNAGSVGIKFGMVAGAVAAEYFLIRKHPDLEKPLIYSNLGASGLLTGVAVRNWRIR